MMNTLFSDMNSHEEQFIQVYSDHMVPVKFTQLCNTEDFVLLMFVSHHGEPHILHVLYEVL